MYSNKLVYYLEINFKELGSHRFDLLFHSAARVKTANDGSHIFSLTDGCQAGNAAADDQNFRRRNLTSGSNLAGEETTKVIGCFDYGAIAGDVGHRAQGIEDLGTRNTRNTIHG